MSRTSRKLALAVALALTLGAVAAGIAIASSGGDDPPLSGSTLDRAKAAALEQTGGGTVVESEIGDDGAAYGVEIRRDDGSQVEVGVSQDFKVVGSEADDDGSGGEGSANEDEDGDD